jgi:heme/copper-type cytochrome/quinol oxidase subunit 3
MALNAISTVGAFLMGLGTLVFLWNVIKTLRNGPLAGDNPWDAFTLEWGTSSPPPEQNFVQVPPVKSRRPVWDLNHPELADWKTRKTPEDRRTRHGSSPKFAASCFIISEAMFFLLLVSSYIVFNRASGENSPAHMLEVGRTGVFTFLLLASSVTFWLAERALRKSNQNGCLFWLGLTLVLGTTFLLNQGAEYAGLIHNGVTISSSLFGSTFFTVTGFHGLHVFGGLVVLAIMFFLGKSGRLTSSRTEIFGAIGYYWHFVDVVWIVVFSVIYLRVLA